MLLLWVSLGAVFGSCKEVLYSSLLLMVDSGSIDSFSVFPMVPRCVSIIYFSDNNFLRIGLVPSSGHNNNTIRDSEVGKICGNYSGDVWVKES